MKELTLNKRQRNIAMASVLTVACVLYALVSLVNHYCFKTYALDLGLYTHALYQYAHLHIADCGMFKDAQLSILSDHFDLYLPILSPLVFAFGSYTLLLVQIAAVLMGAFGVYKLIGLYTDDNLLPVLASATLLFSFGVIHPFAFDYHSNVLTAMMLPWLLYYLKRGRYGLATLFVVLFVIGKENMSLWLFFIAIALMWDYRKDKKALWYLAGYAVFSLAYFIIINMIVMPKLGGAGGGFSRYHYLGENYVEVAKNLVLHPGNTIRLLTTNMSGLESFDGVKAEFYYCALATGLLLTILKPNYLVMLIPLVAQKMLASDGNFWGVSYQYSVECMPVIVISSFLVILKYLNSRWRVVAASVLLVSTLLTTFYTIGVPKTPISVDQLCVYQGRHYRQSKFDADYARQLIEMIPDDAHVCAASMFVPHLALREKIEDFAASNNTKAEYVLITDHYFGFKRYGQPIFSRDGFEEVATDGTLYLFRRIRP